ncbi:MAG: tyrosine-protein phosphatase [Actinobacteria bacterium]|nr:MAG: tyrosine-protein phosphatase [Actinomycetota bacterium]
MTRVRVLVWDGCVNVRDLGGLPLEGGGETNFGVLVRADSIGTLTEAGWAALQDYGVTTAVDLRGEHELEEPADAQQRPIRIVSIPIAPRSGPGWNWPSMLDAYLGVLEEFRPQFVAAVVAVAAAEPPVVIHCQGGRDRTGLVVALVLRCAGVDPEAIALDHAISDDSWAPYNPTWFDEAADEDERARRHRIAIPAGRTIAQVLEDVDREYGGPRAFLDGVSTEHLDRLVLRLRGD